MPKQIKKHNLTIQLIINLRRLMTNYLMTTVIKTINILKSVDPKNYQARILPNYTSVMVTLTFCLVIPKYSHILFASLSSSKLYFLDTSINR